MVSVQSIDFKSILKAFDRETKTALHLPSDPEFSNLKGRYSERTVKQAGAILLPTTAEEVSAAMKFVNEHSIDLAVVCGGHSCSGASSSEGGLVIDLRLMRTVTVDPEKMIVTCGGGCLWKDVDMAAGEHGLAVVGGTVGHVGVGGLTLGGGFGYLTGKYGLVIDNLLAVELVLASGEIVTASKEQNSDLFWAVCGAGPNFGVITKFTFKAHEQKNKISVGPLVFAPTPEVISGLLDFLNSFFGSEQDDGKAFVFVFIICAPPDFKNPVIMLMAFYNGSLQESNKFYKPLLDLNPLMNMMTERPYKEASSVLAELAPAGGRKFMTGFTFTLPLKPSTFNDALSSYKELVDKYPQDAQIGVSSILFDFISQKKVIQLDNGCYVNRGNYYNGLILPQWTLADSDNDIMEWTRKINKELTVKNGVIMKDGREPFYPNYDDVDRPAKDTFGDNYPRLVELKLKYDPQNVFNKWHSLIPEDPAGH